jgi:oligopeptide transport system ATP-binding protein
VADLDTPVPRGEAPLLAVEDLHVEFRTTDGVLPAVRGISYTLGEGECLAIVGESGSGKTVSAQAVLGLLDRPPAFVTAGSARFRGQDLLTLSERELRKVRGRRIALVLQDALSSLNPVFPVGQQIGDMFRTHQGLSRRDARVQAVRMMERVRIPNASQRADSYPHELSGGMRQRVMIAMAVALGPDVLIADEPTTALDVTIQAQIIGLLAELREETGLGLILITHDLSVVAEVADRVAVMYAGRIVEVAPVRDLYRQPAHPYTVGLLASIPRVDCKGGTLVAVEGSPPDLRRIPSGCSFHPRCPRASPRCRDDGPPLAAVAVGRTSACHFAEAVLDERR